ncbi:MAG: hypothetical protein HZB30_02615 [Nitrospirae bacterium]|nr:hypothetical protein [Nitrospirota bacterium]
MAFTVWSITTDYSYLAAGRLGGYDREERCVLKDSEREQQTAQSPQPANLDQVSFTTSAGICVEYIKTGNCRQSGSPPFI